MMQKRSWLIVKNVWSQVNKWKLWLLSLTVLVWVKMSHESCQQYDFFFFFFMEYFSTLIKCCQSNKSIHILFWHLICLCSSTQKRWEMFISSAVDFYAASVFLDSFFSISNSYVLRKLNAGLYTKRILRNTWIPSVLVSNNLLRRVRAGAGEKCGHRGVEKCIEVGKYPNTHTETIYIRHTYKASSNLKITKEGMCD